MHIMCPNERLQYQMPRKLPELPAKELLAHLAIDLPGSFLRLTDGHELVLGMTDKLSKFKRAMPSKKNTSKLVTDALLVHWSCANETSEQDHTNNVPQFTVGYFEHAMMSLSIKHFLTSTYHSQTNVQAEHYNNTLASPIMTLCRGAQT